MKQSKFFISIIVLLVVTSSLLGAMEYNIITGDRVALPDGRSEADIISVVEGALDLDAAPYYKANVKPVIDAAIDKLVVYLLRSDIYLAECYLIDVDDNLDVVAVVDDYVEVEEAVRDEECRACPDPDIEMLFTTSETTIGEAMKGVERAYDIAVGKGFKAKKIIDRYEVTASLIQSYLSCPNLKLYGRIGHGMKDRILFADGTTINSSWLSGQSSDFLSGKTIYLNSCQVHNSPWEPAIMSIGTYAFVGGNVDLGIGTSEYVFTCWLDKVLSGAEMKQTVTDCEIEQNYPRGDHGFSGIGQGPWYYNVTTPTPTVTPTPTATPTMTPIITNVALGKPVTASGQFSADFPKAAINDGNDGTVWGSKMNQGNQWFFLDLGRETPITDVIIKFYNPYYSPYYHIGVSNDAKQWQFAVTETNGNGDVDKHTINKTARYIGVLLTKGAKNVYGVKEFEVYTSHYPTTPTPTATATPSNNQVVNGGFDAGMASWDIYVDATATADISVVDGEAQVAITSGGSQNWHVQLSQMGMSFTNGRTYTVTFDAKADSARSVTVIAGMSQDPYLPYGEKVFNLSTTMQQYSYSFTMSSTSDSTAVIEFDCGIDTANVTIDNVVVSK